MEDTKSLNNGNANPQVAGKPLVSVCCFCKNEAKTIGRCIDSILMQDYPNVEILIQDGCSDDGTLDILKGYGNKVDIVSEPDKGPNDAMFRVLNRVKGSIFMFCLADEQLEQGAISWAVRNLEENPDTAAIFSDIYITDVDGNVKTISRSGHWGLEKYLCSEWTPPLSGSFFRTSCYRAIGIKEYTASDEFDFWLELGTRFRIKYIPDQIIAKYALHDGAISFQISHQAKRYQSRRRAIEKICSSLNTPESICMLREKALKSLDVWNAIALCSMGDFDITKGHLQRAFENGPNKERLSVLARKIYDHTVELYQQQKFKKSLELLDLLVNYKVQANEIDTLRDQIGLKLAGSGFQDSIDQSMPDSSELFHQGYEYLQNGQFDEAISCFEKTEQINPKLENLHFAWGSALLKLNRLQEAKQAFEKELAIQPGHSAAQKLIKQINQQVNNTATGESDDKPKFSFIMIVLNGMPFIEYSLKSIYDFAHEIIIVEGAVENCLFAANPDGSSQDGTVEFIRLFPDPKNKIKLIQGRWPEKCEMQNKALESVTGNYVWLIDSDEVYKKDDLKQIKSILTADRSISQVNFIPDNFWKGLDYIFTSPKFFDPRHHYRRLFKFVPGAVFTTHRPPTMVWPQSNKTTEQIKLLDGATTRNMGIILYHYSYVLDSQVAQKIELYHRYGWGKSWNIDLVDWYNNCYGRWQPWTRDQIDAAYPIWTGDRNSHTEPFKGTHPDVMADYVIKTIDNNDIAMSHVVDAVEEIKQKFPSDHIKVIETGTIRSFYEKHFSTYHIANTLRDRGDIVSVDICPESINISKFICRDFNNIEFVLSDSVKYLRGLKDQKIHLAFLDSANEKNIIFDEFRNIADSVVEGGIVMVDDAGILADGRSIDNTVAAQKAHKVWQFCRDNDIKFNIVSTNRGHGTQLKIVMTADNKNKINTALQGYDSNSQAVDSCQSTCSNLLIVRSDSIGDFIIFGGSLKYYKKLYPQSKITLVVSETVAELAVACPYVDSIMVFNRHNMVYDNNYATDFMRQLNEDHYDVAIAPALSRDKVSDFIVINSNSTKKIASSGDGANLSLQQIVENNKYFTKIVPMSPGIKLETLRNEEFLKALGIEFEEPYKPDIWLTRQDISYADDLLSQYGMSEPIVIAPFAQSDIRNWSLEKWAQIISNHKDQEFIIVGLQSHTTQADEIIRLSGHDNVCNICGQTTIRQLAALVAKAKACITCESATAHIAATVGVKNIVLTGGGHFGRFVPYNKSTELVYNKMDCYNCNWNCVFGKDIRCINSITVDMVEQKLNHTLSNNPGVTVISKENQILVSAIVSTYNSEKFIQGCLEDLVNQTLYSQGKLEIIVVNSGSQENEEQVVKQFQQKYSNIVYIKTENREGIYSAWNRAVKAAKGRFLTSANTDDRHRHDALEVMANELLANENLALVYGDQIVTKTANATFENHYGVDFTARSEYSHQRMLFGCCVGSQPMWRAELHEQLGYFDESLTCAGDWDFWLRISEKYDMKRIPEFLGIYYHNEQGIEHSKKIHSLYERYLVGKRYGNGYISIIPLYEHPQNPLVSVIMPVYNGSDHIAEAIESVLIQNYQNLELIIVNDGSTDDTEQVIKKFNDERIKYFVQQSAGASAARNSGIQQSKGQFVIMLDHDDMMTPDFIAQHLKTFESNPNADLVYCDDLLIDSDGNNIRVITRPEYNDQKYLIRDLFKSGFPIVPFRTCIRKNVFDKIGLYDQKLVIGEDYDMIKRFAKNGLVAKHLKGSFYIRRIVTDSLSKGHTPKKAVGHFNVVKSFIDTFEPDQLFPDLNWNNIPAENRQLHFMFLCAMTIMTIANDYVKTNSPVMAKAGFDSAIEILNHCLKISPDNQDIIGLLEKCSQVNKQMNSVSC